MVPVDIHPNTNQHCINGDTRGDYLLLAIIYVLRLQGKLLESDSLRSWHFHLLNSWTDDLGKYLEVWKRWKDCIRRLSQQFRHFYASLFDHRIRDGVPLWRSFIWIILAHI